MPIGKSFQLLEQPHVDANGTVSCHMGSTHRTWNKGCGHAEKLLAGNLRSKTLNSAMSYRRRLDRVLSAENHSQLFPGPSRFPSILLGRS
jgi:hypothetical protein